jgi:hypothetical protein
MVSIDSKARLSEYDANILTSESVLAAASVLMLLLCLYPTSLCSSPCETHVCVRLTSEVFPCYDKLATCTSQEEFTQHPRSNLRPVSSLSSLMVIYSIILPGVVRKSRLRRSDF